MWAVNHGPLKSCRFDSFELQQLTSGSEDILETALNAVLQRNGKRLVLPTEDEFVSAIPESHRKNEKTYHVKAHRGSKDGEHKFKTSKIGADNYRLSIFSGDWNLLWIQETTGVFPI